MTQGPQTHATVRTQSGLAVLRDTTEDDVPAMVDYFFRPDAHLDSLIDRSRLPPKAVMADGFRRMIRTGEPGQLRTTYAIDLDGRLIGFTSLYRQTADVNHSHWHIIDEGVRAGGVSSALYPHRIRLYFDLYPIERLIHQTKTSNIGVNRMLDKFVPVAKTEWVANPDGLASPGEFAIRYVRRADIPRIVERAKELGLL
jgi:hypothetical protein